MAVDIAARTAKGVALLSPFWGAEADAALEATLGAAFKTATDATVGADADAAMDADADAAADADADAPASFFLALTFESSLPS